MVPCRGLRTRDAYRQPKNEWSAEAKDPPNFPFNENSGFLIDIPENACST